MIGNPLVTRMMLINKVLAIRICLCKYAVYILYIKIHQDVQGAPKNWKSASILYTEMMSTIHTLVWRVHINKGKTMIGQWVGKNSGSSHLSSMWAMMTMMTITTSATRAALDPSLPFLGSDNSAFLHLHIWVFDLLDLHIWVFDLLDFAHSCNCVSVGQGKCCRLVGTIKIGLILQLMRHLQDDIYAQDVLRCYLHMCTTMHKIYWDATSSWEVDLKL